MSTFRCDVVPVTLEPHPNADSLSLVRVGGYTVCVRTADWEGVDRGVYIPPDSVVPATGPFELQWLPYGDFIYEIGGADRRAPELFKGPFDPQAALALAEEYSSLYDGYREGVVICTTEEQTCPEIGRLQLKMVSNRYLEKS